MTSALLATLTTQEQVEALIVSPSSGWILKHSCTCPVSTAAHDEVLSALARHPLPAGMVVVQESRPLSNWLAARLGYVHQSPQLFLVRGGTVLWQASHWGITSTSMAAAVGRTAAPTG